MKTLQKLALVAALTTGLSGVAMAEDAKSMDHQVPKTQIDVDVSADVGTQDVTAAQKALAEKGYAVVVDGEMNDNTVKAIMKFQQDNNLPVTGTLDAQTRAALELK